MHALLLWGRPLGARHFSYPSLRPIDQPMLLRRFHPTALAQLRCILHHMVEGSAQHVNPRRVAQWVRWLGGWVH